MPQKSWLLSQLESAAMDSIHSHCPIANFSPLLQMLMCIHNGIQLMVFVEVTIFGGTTGGRITLASGLLGS